MGIIGIFITIVAIGFILIAVGLLSDPFGDSVVIGIFIVIFSLAFLLVLAGVSAIVLPESSLQ